MIFLVNFIALTAEPAADAWPDGRSQPARATANGRSQPTRTTDDSAAAAATTAAATRPDDATGATNCRGDDGTTPSGGPTTGRWGPGVVSHLFQQ